MTATGPDPPPERRPAGRFETTRWSLVLAARDRAAPGAREALAALCSAYWYPLYAFIRRRGHDPDAAADLTQGFFADLLERDVLAAADPSRGRFRSYLRAACSHFLANERDRDGALKRGGGHAVVSIDARDPEGHYLREPAHDLTAQRLYERAWALTLLGRVLACLRREYEDAGRGATFDQLKAVLTDGPRAVSYASLAGRLGTTEGAVQVAVHRLRRRYRAILRDQISATLDDDDDVEDEIRALFAALGR